jgi:DNA-binding NtrC family response regulator
LKDANQTRNLPVPLRKELPLRKATVLVVDDEELYRRALERILKRVGYEVVTARDASEAMGIVSSQPIDLVLSDVQMPGINGLELVRQVHEVDADLPCIVITGYGSPESSVDALRAGAFWYLEKPFEQGHLDVVRRLAEQAIEHGRLKHENRLLQRQLESRHQFESIVGESHALRRVLETVERVSGTDSTVLVTGESGTGKELIARAIHYNSPRSDRMMVTVNCGAIPEELLEAELFGHVRGAFTNAVSHREGRFALADGGSIFLDEIGDMSMNLQVKLLRVLQERTFEPVGSSKPQSVDVRVIAATNQRLPELIEAKKFREDLSSRLNVIPLEVPPLRERREDIPALIHHFIEWHSDRGSTSVKGIHPAAVEALCRQPWPGNVRELQNLVERLVILRREGEIGLDDLPAEYREPAAPPPTPGPSLAPEGMNLRGELEEIEAHWIRQALERTGWNKNRAAQLLQVNRTTLLEKIKKYGIEPA